MSRLDRHVSNVQNKLAMHQFVRALAWAAFFAGCAVVVGVITWRVLGRNELPAVRWWLIGGGGVVIGAAVFAILHRPGAYEAAVAIDDKLQLKEKFSTALSVRPSKDLFAQAAVRDAEVTADNVVLQQQFPVTFPKIGYGAILMIALAFTLGLWMQPMDLFGHQEEQAKKATQIEQQQADSKRKVEQALAVAEMLPRNLQEDPKLKAEITKLHEILKPQKFDDPNGANRKAQEVLQDVQQALADEARKVEEKVIQEKKTFSDSFGNPDDYQSEEAKKIDKDLAAGKFDKAADDFQKMAENFGKMNQEEQKKLADDMANLQKKMESVANDPKTQKEIEDTAKQMGMKPEEAKKMAENIQGAAQGNPQAQQSLQKQMQQMQAQMQAQQQQLQQQASAGNQQAQQQLAQLQQQQQAIQKTMQGMQGKANAQAQAQQMGQATKQMAQAMQQQAGQPGKQGQQGQQPGQGGQQQMAQAQAQMQQAVQAMQAGAADAQQIQAAQAAANKQAGQGGQGKDGKDGQGAGQGEGQQAQAVPGDQGKGGQWNAGDPNQNQGGGGPGQAGIGNGGQIRDKVAAGFDTKSEHDIGEERKDGRILANTMIKDNQPVKGEAKLGLAQVTESVQKQASDEVDEDHVSGASRKAAEDYFRTMNQDAKK